MLAVVDILPRLAARCAVHVENDVNAVPLAPCDAGIDKMQRRCTESDRTVGCDLEKQTGIEREPHGVHPLRGDPRNVFLGDVGREILRPKRSGIFHAAQPLNKCLNPARSVALGIKFPHIPFRKQPAAETHAAQEDRLSSAIQFAAFCVKKLHCRHPFTAPSEMPFKMRFWKNA